MSSVSPFRRLRTMLGTSPIGRTLRRAVDAALPDQPVQVPTGREIVAAPPSGVEIARERARRALSDARQAMSGVIGEESRAVSVPEPASRALAAEIDRLRTQLAASERERERLYGELTALRASMDRIEARLDQIVQATAVVPATNSILPSPAVESPPISDAGPVIPATAGATTIAVPAEPEQATADAEPAVPEPAASAESITTVAEPSATPETPIAAVPEPRTPTPDVQHLRERVLRALRDRVFAAGTVGTRIDLQPPPPPDELDAIVVRLTGEPAVDHAEVVNGGGSLRVSLRTPLRWEQFGALLERALATTLAPTQVSWAGGAVHIRLPADGGADRWDHHLGAARPDRD